MVNNNLNRILYLIKLNLKHKVYLDNNKINRLLYLISQLVFSKINKILNNNLYLVHNNNLKQSKIKILNNLWLVLLFLDNQYYNNNKMIFKHKITNKLIIKTNSKIYFKIKIIS